MARKQSKKKAAVSKGRLDVEIKRAGKHLDQLMAAARKTEASVRASSTKQLATLKRKQAEAKVKLAKLSRQSAAASGPMKTGLRKAWRDIELAVRQATKRFRETT